MTPPIKVKLKGVDSKSKISNESKQPKVVSHKSNDTKDEEEELLLYQLKKILASQSTEDSNTSDIAKQLERTYIFLISI